VSWPPSQTQAEVVGADFAMMGRDGVNRPVSNSLCCRWLHPFPGGHSIRGATITVPEPFVAVLPGC
jgi:hypothetical protein